MEYENAQKRILEVYTQWKAPSNFKIQLSLSAWATGCSRSCDLRNHARSIRMTSDGPGPRTGYRAENVSRLVEVPGGKRRWAGDTARGATPTR